MAQRLPAEPGQASGAPAATTCWPARARWPAFSPSRCTSASPPPPTRCLASQSAPARRPERAPSSNLAAPRF
eukprot:14162160-Alexandrium_andersonii.AAC.1